jgi:hypothetical protein
LLGDDLSDLVVQDLRLLQGYLLSLLFLLFVHLLNCLGGSFYHDMTNSDVDSLILHRHALLLRHMLSFHFFLRLCRRFAFYSLFYWHLRQARLCLFC